ncbi:MAG: 2-oxoacid:acceptor oxidoreductase family protein [Gemmatimonadota bacterium]|nr:2-oxoacid:acceptor oxidoreductase family protein [Gemmatimonadota bacterium]
MSATKAGDAGKAKYPGSRQALDGSYAVVAMETASSEAAGAYPITPSTQMGEGWAQAVAEGKENVNGRRLLFFEPEGEHAAAAVTAGMSMAGLRSTNFSSGQGIAYMHESLYAAVGKRLTYVLNVAARAITKHALNVHAGHDDYHAVDDTGFFQIFAKDVQESADLNVVAHRIAELSLNPGIIAQDGFLTSHVIESLQLPERELLKEYLGDPADFIESPTPAQRMVFGDKRRRIPEMFDLDYPAMLGVVQNQDSYAQGVAAQRPFYFDHIAALTDQAFAEYAALTGRKYARVSGYRLEDAEWVIAGQGSVVSNAEAVVDYLRDTRGLKVGVLNLTMFRPFPSDLITRMLAGKKGVVVMERTDQPLAVDPPMLREIRAAMAKGVENGRNANVHDGLAALRPEQVPNFFTACFGLGSRDLQPGDIVAAVDNMLPGGKGRRQVYLGIDFIREGTKLPKLQIWQETLEDKYPHLKEMTLPSAGEINLLPKGSTALRIHSVGGWGAITMGKNLAMTAFELFDMFIKANPKYGSEKKGQPTTFYAVLAHEPIRLNCELKHVDIVLSPDPNVFRHSDPLAGLAQGGVFIIQTDLSPEAFWQTLPAMARRTILDRKIKLYTLDAFAIAQAEASDVELRYRMQGAAFMGAFFRTSPILEREKQTEEALFKGIEKQLQKKFGSRGARVVEDNVRVIRRGYDEVKEVRPVAGDFAAEKGDVPHMPVLMEAPNAQGGIGHEGRFWEQVCAMCKIGQDGIADPFAAISAIPAATGAVRDMSGVRLEVPEFLAEKCTGCSQCWIQCPDSAIPGLVSSFDDVLSAAMSAATNGLKMERIRPIAKNWAKEAQKLLQKDPTMKVSDAFAKGYDTVATKMGWDAERRAATDVEFHAVQARIANFPLARTKPFFDALEGKSKGSGGLLSITINPETCKGCNLCVEVCPDGALQTIKQDEPSLLKLRSNWEMWNKLPDTDDRFINVSDVDEGIGVLSSLLLKKDTYRAMVGGDGACMGCGEKTAVHLILSAIFAQMAPKVAKQVAKLDTLITALEDKAREIVGSTTDLGAALSGKGDAVKLDAAHRHQLELIGKAISELKDLRWRYVEGPSGKGRAMVGMSNSTGCSSVWASTYPYNPYPFPWVNHLFQDSTSVAVGLFDAHMRKMGDGFIAVRRAEKLVEGSYEHVADEAYFKAFTWQEFTDDEFFLCPPIIAMGGDGAMLDIGFQNLSRLLASGKPVRVIILDTQVYSNTGGQACTSGYTGQVADMSGFGKAQHGKTELRKEIGLIGIAHRGTFVHQSSQAAASHLIAGVLKGMHKRRPALFNIYTPCPVEHGLADDWSKEAARFALESRAFPFLTYDPDNGNAFADCLSLEGNPSPESDWPTYDIRYLDDAGVEQTMEVPLTVADWAATESRFKQHFSELPKDLYDYAIPFADFLKLSKEERAHKTAFIYAVNKKRNLRRLKVSTEMAALADERLQHWSQLRQLAGIIVSETARNTVSGEIEAEFEVKMAALRAEYEAKMAQLKKEYPQQIARRLAEGLMRHGGGGALGELLATLPAVEPSGNGAAPVAAPVAAAPAAAEAPAAAAPAAVAAPVAAPAAAAPAAAEEDESMGIEAYIDSARCTSCNECTNLNKKMFVYNAAKQAEIKDVNAGTFQQLVLAAERCPVSIIHPGTPVNPKEKDLEKWVKRAERFN